MKSRILKAVLAMVVPNVIKKFTEKKDVVQDPNRQIPSPH